MEKFRYSINNKLITCFTPLKDRIPIIMSDLEAKNCIGFDSEGVAIYNQSAINAGLEKEKRDKVDKINSEFISECLQTGVLFEGKKFQYDDTSRSRLLETKDDSRVTFWRSVDNVNVNFNNSKKNELYELLKLTYYTKFAESRQAIDAL